MRVSADVPPAAEVAADQTNPEIVGRVAFGAPLLGNKLWGLKSF